MAAVVENDETLGVPAAAWNVEQQDAEAAIARSVAPPLSARWLFSHVLLMALATFALTCIRLAFVPLSTTRLGTQSASTFGANVSDNLVFVVYAMPVTMVG